MASAESKQPSGSAISGKLVIIGIVTVAVCAAAISWYFRYQATHRAAKFWGAAAATIIRDAPVVIVNHDGNKHGATAAALKANNETTSIDVSRAHGLTHLRNALLEDHNFDWTTVDKPPDQAGLDYWLLKFADPKAGKGVTIWLSDDFRVAFRPDSSQTHSVALDPVMTKGLREMFAEFSANPAGDATTQAR
jgi:hypothetical protein